MTKGRFWIGTLSVPLIIAVVFGLIFLSNTTTDTAAAAQKSAQFSISYTDASGLITAADAALFGATPRTPPTPGSPPCSPAPSTRSSTTQRSPSRPPCRVYGADQGLFENGKYAAVAQAMLTHAVEQTDRFAATVRARGRTGADRNRHLRRRRGIRRPGLGDSPMVFLVIFYGLIVLLAGQMLNSTLEEKENRVTEMILTTLKPTTLIAARSSRCSRSAWCR